MPNRPAILTGNLGGNPELRFTPNGAPVANFSLALYAGKNQENEVQTTWVRITCWNNLAEVANKALEKGQRVQCAGYLQEPRLWEDSNGETHGSLEMTAFSISTLPKDIQAFEELETENETIKSSK